MILFVYVKIKCGMENSRICDTTNFKFLEEQSSKKLINFINFRKGSDIKYKINFTKSV